jgi:hypothetical protein
MMNLIPFKSISVMLTEYGTDIVFVETDLPYPIWGNGSNLTMKFEVSRNCGIDYVRKNFGVEPKLTNVRSNKPFMEK